jgi:DNA-binding response OmpR family regulator
MKTILLVDDDQDFLHMIRYVLLQEGYRVLIAQDGKMAVSIVRQDRPNLILMDMKMPGHDGPQTAGYLKAISRFSGIPVVFLTGAVSPNRSEGGNMMEIDGQAYPMILKTVDKKELIDRVKQYIAEAEKDIMRVLIVEDSPTDAHFIRRMLEKSSQRHFEVSSAVTLKEAEERLLCGPQDVIVLDLGLPDSQKKETLLWMLKQDLPIVVMTADDERATVGEAFRHGAQDYLVKGDVSEREVVRCVMYAVERKMVNKEMMFYKNNFERIVKERVNERIDGAIKSYCDKCDKK